jgi:hypothetical protein
MGMFEQTFKNIDDILHKDAGCGSELDYVEQTSWFFSLNIWMIWKKTVLSQQNLLTPS